MANQTFETRLKQSSTKTKHNMVMRESEKFTENVIYQIDFSNGEVYIGSTIEKLSSRISKHVYDSHKWPNRPLYKVLLKHKLSGNVKIIDKMTSSKNLRGVESLHIEIARLKYGKKLLNVRD